MRMARLRQTLSRAVLGCQTACNVPSSRWRHSCWQEVEAKSRLQRQLCRTKSSVKVSSTEECQSGQSERERNARMFVISAEERVKDKLALIARDKLNGMISREKQLQLERKRKAMAFLNQIKG